MDTRAKPLNALTRSALPTGVQAWDDEIEYLNDALEPSKSSMVSAELRERLTVKRDALVRSREWLQAKLDSVEA